MDHAARSKAPMAREGGKGIGRSVRRREDEALIRGQGCYTADIVLENALQVHFSRSMSAHGRLVAVDVEAAIEAAGVRAVFVGTDVAHLGDLTVNEVVPLASKLAFPVLAHGDVGAVGQPIAAIVADSEHAACDAADLIHAEMEDLPASPDPDWNDGDRILLSHSWGPGETDRVFGEAAHVVSAEVEHPRLAASPMECRGIAVKYQKSDGSLTVWLSTQTPHLSRKELARITGIDAVRLRVIAPDVGGAFGMKASLYPEEVFVVWAAAKLECSLRWIATRGEDLLSATHGRGMRSHGELAVDGDGGFLGLRARIETPMGHWMPTSTAISIWNTGRILPGPYRVEHVDIAVRGAVTTSAAMGIYRGAGRPEATVLMERLVDAAAAKLGMEPDVIRTRNLIETEQLPHTGPTGIVLDSGDYHRALGELLASPGYGRLVERREKRRADGGLYGLGFGFYIEPCGRGWESAHVRLNSDGSIDAATGTSAQGHGRETAFAQIIADVLDVAPDRVTILHGDTDTCPDGIGALASRSSGIGGSALWQAASEVKAKTGGDLSPPEPVDARVVYEAEGETWGYGCYLAAVTIDRDTGAMQIEEILAVDDVGTVINPMLVDGQVRGGIAQGVGEALLERIVYDDDGQLLTGSLMDYALPRADDMPAIEIRSFAVPSAMNLLGAKGVGEAGTIGAPAAILNAAFDALSPLGIEHLDLPLTSEQLWRAISTAAVSKI